MTFKFMAMLNNIFGGQPPTNNTFTTSSGTGNLNASGSWGISGQTTPQFTNSQPINLHFKCKRCGYKDNEYSDKYCILCNEEL